MYQLLDYSIETKGFQAQ